MWLGLSPAGLMDLAMALNALDLCIAHSVLERALPGLSIAVIRDRHLIWARGYGMADLETKIAASPSTRYRIGSVSKLFTAMAIMQLRDAGRLHLDETVRTYLPAFTYHDMHPEGPPITVRHVLAHTSGLARDIPLPPGTDPKALSRHDIMVRVGETKSLFPAGRDWRYSNLGYWLLGEIMIAVTGRPYADYVEREILGPLGMHATHIGSGLDLTGLATGYGMRVAGSSRPRVEVPDAGPLLSTGTVASSVEDLARFAALNMSDDRGRAATVVCETTLHEMREVQWQKAGWQGSQGLGFGIRKVGEQRRIGHHGRPPGYRACLSIAPDARLAVVVLINATDANAVHYSNRAFALLNAVSRGGPRAGP